VTLKRALGRESLVGTVGYNLEDVGILMNVPDIEAPPSIREQEGYSLLNKFKAGITYDTRGPGTLPDRGQKTELMTHLAVGDQTYYQLNFSSYWYLKGLLPGHVLELIGEAGVGDAFGSTSDVPFYDRFYLGGLFNLRGFKYRSVSPRESVLINGNVVTYSEPVGGDTYYYLCAEYSIPILTPETERGLGIRFAVFYDGGAVSSDSYDFTSGYYNSDAGVGLRLNLPIGPLRLDYAFPITHDQYNGSSGRFQFGIGYTRKF
jgi:outer membrane protein insertion porin family